MQLGRRLTTCTALFFFFGFTQLTLLAIALFMAFFSLFATWKFGESAVSSSASSTAAAEKE